MRGLEADAGGGKTSNLNGIMPEGFGFPDRRAQCRSLGGGHRALTFKGFELSPLPDRVSFFEIEATTPGEQALLDSVTPRIAPRRATVPRPRLSPADRFDESNQTNG